MEGDNFAAQYVRVGDSSKFRQGHDFHGPVTIVNKGMQLIALHMIVRISMVDRSSVFVCFDHLPTRSELISKTFEVLYMTLFSLS